jgi:D-amino-acid dehydrogenase
MSRAPPHVAVIGAGIVGAATAIELLARGHRVTIIEPDEPGGPQAASFGNGGWISPASIVPMSMPGLWRRIPGFLAAPAGPLTIRWRALPGLVPWLTRFVLAGCTVARVEATARHLRWLLADAPARHVALAAAAGVPHLIRQTGLIYAFPDRAAFEAEALGWRLRRDNGVVWRELDPAGLAALVPALSPRYRFAVLIPDGAYSPDPGAYVAALVAHAVGLGAVVVPCRATGFDIGAGQLQAVITAGGPVPCNRAVIAAGIHSSALARAAGDAVPLASERGYHVNVAGPAAAPAIPVMPGDAKMANTTTCAGLRAAGQVELCATDSAPDWRRTDILLAHLLSAYPGLSVGEAGVSRWVGDRPSTPDGLPVLGPASGCGQIAYAFGHGHVGLATGPVSGALIAELLCGGAASLGLDPFSPRRF